MSAWIYDPVDHTVILPCPECGGDITVTVYSYQPEFATAARWGGSEYERECGCQLDGFPDTHESDQPISRLFTAAIKHAQEEARP